MTHYETTNLAATILSEALHTPVHVTLLDWPAHNCYHTKRHVCAALRARVSVSEAERERYVCLCVCHDEHDSEVLV